MTKYEPEELPQVFGAVLRRFATIFDAHGQPWMLIGGLAIGAWTEPRGTKDCDFAVALPADVAGFEAALLQAGFSAAVGSFAEVSREGGVVRTRSNEPSSRPVFVDLLCAGTDFERSALARRRPLEAAGVQVYVATPDDLVVYKLIAGRGQDFVDIERLIRFGVAPEDEAYVRRWAKEWGVEDRLDAALRAAST